MTKTVHRVKVTLRDVKPPVWRRIVVRSETSLAELAAVLEAAMGWEGYHLHLFDVGGAEFGIPDSDLDFLADDRRYRLGDLLPAVGSKMRWDYDFGDGWQHDVLVEAVSLPERVTEYPVCLTGRRACPPEDCGGIWGYGNLLEALADPNHPEHAELSAWAPSDFDPARFDVDETNTAMRWPRPWDYG